MRLASMALIFLVLALSLACISPATPTPTSRPPLQISPATPTPEPPAIATDAEKIALANLAEKTAKGLYEIREVCVSQEHSGKLTLTVAEKFIEGETIYEAIALEIEAFEAAHGNSLGNITTPQKFGDLLRLTLAMEYAALRLHAICRPPVEDEQKQEQQ